ncbi:hypothetical protein FA95DRAFT_1613908 [Auriscalpium vulgare]|uniref:Uncharacterized protein n=1 Tax=Auriscalpium vulgare TaxID=40419 RepID=A0ACB8R1G6_9AGAM|nr:hypothetical protein FA95DRAFT_1613908 [Auriscalpium vulgare]
MLPRRTNQDATSHGLGPDQELPRHPPSPQRDNHFLVEDNSTPHSFSVPPAGDAAHDNSASFKQKDTLLDFVGAATSGNTSVSEDTRGVPSGQYTVYKPPNCVSLTSPLTSANLYMPEDTVHLSKEKRMLDELIFARRERFNILFKPIGSLPVEILAHIFSLCMLANSNELFSLRKPERFKLWRWFIVSHVCRHWRDVAIGSPLLWRTVNVMWGPSWIREAARRAKAKVPLSVQPGVPDYRRKLKDETRLSMLQAVNDILPSVRELHLEIRAPHMQSLWQLLASHAPLLTDMTLHHLWDTSGPGVHIIDAPHLVYLAPKLSRISLCGIWFNEWNPQAWMNIVTICLHSLCYAEHVRGQDILDVLGRMPLLQNVELVDAIPQTGNINSSLNIPKLKCLTIEGKVRQVESMLTALNPDPVLVVIKIRAVVDCPWPYGNSDVYSSFPVLATLFFDTASSFSQSATGRVDLYLNSLTDRVGNPRGHQSYPPKLWLAVKLRINKKSPIGGEVGLFFDDDRTLAHIYGDVPDTMDCEKWYKLLERAQTVTTLGVGTCVQSIEILAAIFGQFSIQGNVTMESPEPLICPALRSLILSEKRVAWEDAGFLVEGDDEGSDDATAADNTDLAVSIAEIHGESSDDGEAMARVAIEKRRKLGREIVSVFKERQKAGFQRIGVKLPDGWRVRG